MEPADVTDLELRTPAMLTSGRLLASRRSQFCYDWNQIQRDALIDEVTYYQREVGIREMAHQLAPVIVALNERLGVKLPISEETVENVIGKLGKEFNKKPAPVETTESAFIGAKMLQDVQERAQPMQPLGRFLGLIGPLGKDLALAKSEGVRIMTMSRAKGLTVTAVIICAVEEGIVPRPDTDLGEERRLLYVGMTRAMEYLFCTWAQRRRGPRAFSGTTQVGTVRRHSGFLDSGPVASEHGEPFLIGRWG